MSDKIKKISIIAVIGIVVAVAFYFLYWVRTPNYTLQIVGEAIGKHDVTTFERHVDLDEILPKALDDSLVAYEKTSGKKVFSNPFALSMLQMMKPMLVAEAKQEILKSIKGEVKNDENSEKHTVGLSLTNKLAKKSNKITDVSTISRENGKAVVAVTVSDTELNEKVVVNLGMTQQEDGKWKVYEISNLVDVLVKIEELDKKKKSK